MATHAKNTRRLRPRWHRCLPRAGHSGAHHVIDHDLPVDRVERQFAAADRTTCGAADFTARISPNPNIGATRSNPLRPRAFRVRRSATTTPQAHFGITGQPPAHIEGAYGLVNPNIREWS